MFVTVWLGILDLRTGELVSSNAGHENPAVMTPGSDFIAIREKHSFVVGGMPGVRYRESRTHLEPGTRLFLYTDGVAEASNPDYELFGETRLLEVLNQYKTGTPHEILTGVSNAVAGFAGKEPQADDLTMLCIEFFGKNH